MQNIAQNNFGQCLTIRHFDQKITHANSMEYLIVRCSNRVSIDFHVRREGLTEQGHMSRCPRII